MTWLLRLTGKATDIIDRVAAGTERSYDELQLARLFWSLSYPSYVAHRFRRDYMNGEPASRGLVAKGYLEEYEDKSEEILREVLKEERKYRPEEILPPDIAISQKGKDLMDGLAQGEELNETETAIGRDLWFYCREESNVPPWNIKKLLNMGYLTSDGDELPDLTSELLRDD